LPVLKLLFFPCNIVKTFQKLKGMITEQERTGITA